MQKRITLAAIVAGFAIATVPIHTRAEGNVEKGEKFFKRCTQCHTLEEGKKKIGPSLHQVIGRVAGTESYFSYSDSYVEAGKKGLTWTPENIIAYLEDPKGFMAAFLDDKSAKSKMVVRFKKLSDREDVVAYLQSLQKTE